MTFDCDTLDVPQKTFVVKACRDHARVQSVSQHMLRNVLQVMGFWSQPEKAKPFSLASVSQVLPTLQVLGEVVVHCLRHAVAS